MQDTVTYYPNKNNRNALSALLSYENDILSLVPLEGGVPIVSTHVSQIQDFTINPSGLPQGTLVFKVAGNNYRLSFQGEPKSPFLLSNFGLLSMAINQLNAERNLEKWGLDKWKNIFDLHQVHQTKEKKAVVIIFIVLIVLGILSMLFVPRSASGAQLSPASTRPCQASSTSCPRVVSA